MFAYEPPLDPPSNIWEEYDKPAFIMQVLQDICENILKRGEKTDHQDVLDLVYEHIEEHLDKYLPEADYDDCI